MTISAILTVITDTLIALTLIYCIVLERRIRAFRKQEQSFRTLIGDVAESTREAQGAVSSLRRLLDEFGHRASLEKNKFTNDAPVRASVQRTEQGNAASIDFAAYDNPVSALASRVVALQNKRAVG